MSQKIINLKDIPQYLDAEIGDSVKTFSVALARFKGNDANTYGALGSGTFVRRGAKYGILTAYHCLHSRDHSVSIGPSGSDTLALAYPSNRQIVLLPTDVREQPLAMPDSDEYGPDLTFIEILPSGKLDTLKASASFWDICDANRKLANDLAQPSVCMVYAGFPELGQEPIVERNNVWHEVNYRAFIGALLKTDISRKGDWDYVEATANRAAFPAVPRTFKGVSGGGIWAVQLRVTKEDVWSVHQFCMLGVTFYQGDEIVGKRQIRGHFIESIYDRAWAMKG